MRLELNGNKELMKHGAGQEGGTGQGQEVIHIVLLPGVLIEHL